MQTLSALGTENQFLSENNINIDPAHSSIVDLKDLPMKANSDTKPAIKLVVDGQDSSGKSAQSSRALLAALRKRRGPKARREEKAARKSEPERRSLRNHSKKSAEPEQKIREQKSECEQ